MLAGIPLGVANMTQVKLDLTHRRAILDAVGNPIGEKADPFVQRIEQAISTYHATNELDQDTKPRHVRLRLRRLYDTADKLLEQLSRSDGITHLLIDDLEPGRKQVMTGHIESMILGIGEARIKADSLPNTRHVDFATRFLARDVGLAMKECLGLKPTKTRNTELASGPYAKCLEAVMEAAGRRPNTNMMPVMRAGIALLNATLPTPK